MPVWGLALFGGVLDHYVANFFPTGPRISIIAAIALGTIPALLAEAALTQAGNATFLRKTAARLSFLGSLAIATALDFERLFFLLFILPLIALFYASFGVMGGWVGRRSGTVVTVGVALAFVSDEPWASAFRCLPQANNLSSQSSLGLHAYRKQSPDLPNKEIASPASFRR